MPKVEIDLYECNRDLLPKVCMKCGSDATTRLRRTFNWYPGWILVFVLIGLIGIIVAAILSTILSKKMSLRIPLCDEHRDHWKKRSRWSWILFGLFILASVMLVLILPQNDVPGYVIFLAIAFAFVGWLIPVGIMQQTAIRPQLITDDTITLINVHRDFIDALKEDRRADEDEYEDEMDDYDDWERV